MEPIARRLFRLVEPIHVVTYFADEPTDALMALGMRNYWDGYFAGRSAPLGRVPAGVVHAIFYNFADGEVARHIPRVWDVITPEAALAARERGSVAALRRILGDLADSPGLARAAALAAEAAAGSADRGAGHVRRPPDAPGSRRARRPAVARRHHAARAPRGRAHGRPGRRGHRRDRGAHAAGRSPTALPRGEFGRVHHLPAARLDAVVDGLRARGLMRRLRAG